MYVIGIDEVGRGALAGPVVVGAVLLPKSFRPNNILRDSKKLTPRARENWLEYLKISGIPYSTARVYPKVVDKLNISNAANLAAARALEKLIANFSAVGEIKKFSVILDGGLYLSYHISGIRTRTVIKGDEKFNCVKLASIVAKVTRDRYMVKLHEIYPNYGFKVHKGYGTEYHRKIIKKIGRTPAHRKSFKIS